MKKITLLLSALFLFASTSWGQIIIYQYYEGTSSNKWIEITNVGASAIDLTSPQLYLCLYANAAADDPTGLAPNNNYALTGTIDPGQVLLFKNSSAVLPAYASGTSTTVCNFNGDDLVITSTSNSTSAWADRIDVVGNGDSWGQDKSFYRNSDIISTNVNYTPTEWTEVTNAAVDNATSDLSEYLGTHIYSSGSNSNPVIFNVGTGPGDPSGTDPITVGAMVTDSDGTITTVEVHWGLSSGSYPNTINMSNSSGDVYLSDSDIPPLGTDVTLYFVIYAVDNDGGETTSPEQHRTLPATTSLPYVQAFDAGFGTCIDFSVLGSTKYWNWNSTYQVAQCNGYNSGETEEDWLILPAVNFDDYTTEIMTFDTWYNYGAGDDETDHYLKLFYSSDYQGTGDPSTATWTELSFTQPGAASTWTSSENIDLSSLTGTVYLAFKYYYTDNWRLWEVDNISIHEDMIDVTFQVDMQNQTISGDGVFLVGGFSPYYNDWDLGNLPMDDSDADLIYSITLTLPNSTEFQYKYVNGLDWADAEVPPTGCQYPGETNRYFTTELGDETLDLVCFGLCTNCSPDSYDITFRVDMQNETVSGDGVYLAGSFTNWGTNAETMSNTGGTIWEVTIPLPDLTDQEYKFVNGDPNSGGSWESISNRQLSVPSANTTLSLVCFNSYDACSPPQLFISEVGLPGDNNTVNFIEIYNAGSTTIDFSSGNWYLCRQSNGGANWLDVQMVGSIDPGSTYLNVWDETAFNTLYAPLTADQESDIMYVSGGDDGLFLYYGGDHTIGTLVDAYGVIDEDGTGKDWEYNGSKAVRLRWVDVPSATWHSWEWNIPEGAGSDQTTPGEHKSDVTWQGTTDSYWHNKGDNWSGTYGYIPDASFNVIVPDATNALLINNEAAAACNDLTINTGASVDVAFGNIFDIYGALDISTGGVFNIGSNATQIASVIVYAWASGDATVQRYFQGYDDGANNGWHLISSPVNSMAVAGSDFDPTGTDDDLYYWDESNNLWKNFKANAFDFTNGQGYLNSFQFNGIKSFVGTLNTDDVSVTGLTKDNGGFHLLGNPFTSSLIWNNWAWTMTGIGSVAQIWDESNNNYTQIMENGIIPSTNGFFVEVSEAPGSLTIPKLARTHSLADNYKKTGAADMAETIDLRLTNDENGFYDMCRIGFKADATEAWDSEYDAHKLFGGDGTSQLWSVIDNENFVFNYLPIVYEPYQLPIHFRAGVNATHHIYVEGTESFNGNTDIYLEDLKLEQMINLREQQLYTFTASKGDDENRFILHFNGITSVDETSDIENGQIYAYQNKVYVRFEEVPKDNYTVEVVNMLGQQVFAEEFAPATFNSFTLDEKAGIYFVRLRAENKTAVQKIMINK